MINKGYNGWSNWDTWESYNILSSYEHVFSEAQNTNDLKSLIKSTLKLMGLTQGHLHIDNVNFEELKEKLSNV